MVITVSYDIKHGARLFNGKEETSLPISLQELEVYIGIPKRTKTCYLWTISEKDMLELLDFIDNIPFGCRKSKLQVGLHKSNEWKFRKKKEK